MNSKEARIAICLIVAIVALVIDHCASPVECNRQTSNLRRRQRRNDGGDDHRDQHKRWGYRDEEKNILPVEWHKDYPKCLGQQQSPVNIETTTTFYEPGMKMIEIERSSSEIRNDQKNDDDANGADQYERWQLENNGHTIKLTPLNAQFQFKLTPENDNYRLLQMHFHWRGSEHEVNHHKFAAELHLVHQNVDDSNKLAVIGFLFEMSDTDNRNLAPIIYELSHHLERFNSTSTTYALRFDELLPMQMSKYYRYPGSLTTPGCDEVVQWIVIDTPVLTISENQLLQFQALQDHSGYPILSNSRPIQDVYERFIKRSFEEIKMSNRIIAMSADSYIEVASNDNINLNSCSSFSVFRYSSLSILSSIFSMAIAFMSFF